MAAVKFEAGQLKLRLQTMIERSKDASAFFRVKAEELRTLQDDAFVKETSPSGEKWPARQEVSHYLAVLFKGRAAQSRALNGFRNRGEGFASFSQAADIYSRETRRNAGALARGREAQRLMNINTQTLNSRDARSMRSLTKKTRESKLLQITGTGRRGTIAAATKTGLKLGTMVKYMGYHITGGKKAGKPPKRNFLGLEVDGRSMKVSIPSTGDAAQFWSKLRKELGEFLAAKDRKNG